MTSKIKSERRRRAAANHQSQRRAVATAASESTFAEMDHRATQQFFAKRGLSTDSIKALTDHGVELPEELLFMQEGELRQISGLGAQSLAEVRAYRRRFSREGS